jgi:hypothetical protein
VDAEDDGTGGADDGTEGDATGDVDEDAGADAEGGLVGSDLDDGGE